MFACLSPLAFERIVFAIAQGPQRGSCEPQAVRRSPEGPNVEPVVSTQFGRGSGAVVCGIGALTAGLSFSEST